MYEYTNTIKHISNLPLDVHLMVNKDLEEMIKRNLDLSPSFLTIHYEAVDSKEHLLNLIKLIKDNGVKAGISIKPSTPIKEILDILPYIHLCLIMTVEPGKGGQGLIPETLDKIKELKEYINSNNLDIYIEADGGINLETVDKVKQAGTDILVVGSCLIKSQDYKETVKKLK